jgi:hypothetical protein
VSPDLPSEAITLTTLCGSSIAVKNLYSIRMAWDAWDVACIRELQASGHLRQQRQCQTANTDGPHLA